MNVLKLIPVLIVALSSVGCVEGKLAGFKQSINDRVDAVIGRVAGATRDNGCVLGRIQTQACYYVVTVMYTSGNVVRGKTALKVCEQNRDSGNPAEDCSIFLSKQNEVYFRVKGTAQFQVDKDYELISDVTTPPTDELICVVMDDSTGTPDKNRCEPRERPLKRG